MEEFSARAKRAVCVGLLTLAVFCKNDFFSQSLPPVLQPHSAASRTSRNFKITARSETILPNTEQEFLLLVPDIAPENVSVSLPAFPQWVGFVSYTRGEYITTQHDLYTQINLKLTFARSGEFDLPPIVLNLPSGKAHAAFEKIVVEELRENIVPTAIVKFESGEIVSENNGQQGENKIVLRTATPARFTVYVENGVSLQNFSWVVPKNSLFNELKRFDFDASPNERQRAVAEFEWIPLAEGIVDLPQMSLSVLSYGDKVVNIALPPCVVEVRGRPEIVEENEGNLEPIFEMAFAATPVESADKNSAGSGIEQDAPQIDFAKIAALRSIERRSLLQKKVRAERIALEKSAGVVASQNEASLPLFVLVVFIAFGLFVSALVLWRLKKRWAVVFALALVLAVFAGIYSTRVFAKNGVVLGGNIHPVPENSSATKLEAPRGSRVKIRDEIELWYYIEYNENSGWIKKIDVAVIE